jgi:hypothetical protein
MSKARRKHSQTTNKSYDHTSALKVVTLHLIRKRTRTLREHDWERWNHTKLMILQQHPQHVICVRIPHGHCSGKSVPKAINNERRSSCKPTSPLQRRYPCVTRNIFLKIWIATTRVSNNNGRTTMQTDDGRGAKVHSCEEKLQKKIHVW